MAYKDQARRLIPLMRRYARARFGSQEGGDSAVADVLNAISNNPALTADSKHMRLTLYKLLHRIQLPAVPGPSRPSSRPPWEAAVGRRLDWMPVRVRDVFLLKTIEGLSDAAVAEVLDIDPANVEAILQQAWSGISQSLTTHALIIEDEPLIGLELNSILTGAGHRVAGVARTAQEAALAAHAQSIGLILADIQLADGSSGLDAVNGILERWTAPIIFITAYPQRLLTGARPEPAFIITKPFTREMVLAIIHQALFFEMNAQVAA